MPLAVVDRRFLLLPSVHGRQEELLGNLSQLELYAKYKCKWVWWWTESRVWWWWRSERWGVTVTATGHHGSGRRLLSDDSMTALTTQLTHTLFCCSSTLLFFCKQISLLPLLLRIMITSTSALSVFAAIAASSNIIPSVDAAALTTEELNAKVAAYPASPG